jgi:fucose permease
LLGAVAVPSLPLSIGLFALTGLFFGPVFPMIIAIAGERYSSRPAAISGFLTGVAIIGSVVYPPVMGFMSVAIGLQWAMVGTVALAAVSATALLLVPRPDRRLA